MPRPYRRRDHLLDEYEFLTHQGLTIHQIAIRLGYKSRDAIDQAISRARQQIIPGKVGGNRRPPRPIEHGTLNAYKNRGCRCPECRATNAARSRAERAARRTGLA